ncbi:MAG: hypothetical protein ACJA1R_001950 [Flavobacteriales bacterium]|jgi:hypothetical protein
MAQHLRRHELYGYRAAFSRSLWGIERSNHGAAAAALLVEGADATAADDLAAVAVVLSRALEGAHAIGDGRARADIGVNAGFDDVGGERDVLAERGARGSADA